MNKYYFAYGSNMDWEQMKERCPSAEYYDIAELRGYDIQLNRYSTKKKCDVVGIEEDKSESVWGVVFTILEQSDWDKLDKCEGYCENRPMEENSYFRTKIKVYIEGDDGRPLCVQTHVPVKPNARKKPPTEEYTKYTMRIVTGAKKYGLPPAYIEKLEALLACTADGNG